VTAINGDEITCTTSAHAEGLVDVTMSNGLESAVKLNGFTYVAETVLSLSTNSVSFSVVPGAGSSVGYTVANVYTNAPGGYELTLKSGGSSLVCESNASFTIPSIAADGALTIAGGSHGAWGWSVVEPASAGGLWTGTVPDEPGASDWRIVPAVGISSQIALTDAASAAAGDDYGVYFGAVADRGQPACKYKQSLVITVVGN
jgi:hypothetical protein